MIMYKKNLLILLYIFLQKKGRNTLKMKEIAF
jgi:hypothetical protein